MENMMIEFINMVVEEISKRLTNASIRTDEVVKINGLKLHSVTITENNNSIAPCIYLDAYYDDYKNGVLELSDIIEKILKVYHSPSRIKDFDPSFFSDYEKARLLLRGQLINTELNQDMLQTLPHREVLDLSLIYFVKVDMPQAGEKGSIRVTNAHLRLWGVTEEELYKQVISNMKENDQSTITSLSQMVRQLCTWEDDSLPELNEENCPMYVLTNHSQMNGAAEIINTNTLHTFATSLGKDFIMLPSSIHEWLLLPVTDSLQDVNAFVEMVKEVNDSQLAPNELLSYHVYKYERETGNISIAG